MCLATIPHAMFYGAIAGILARVFPANVRYTGLSLADQMCSLLVGGATPLFAQWLLNTTGSIVGVAVSSALYAAVSLVATLMLLNRTGFRADEPSTAERADAGERGANGDANAGLVAHHTPSTPPRPPSYKMARLAHKQPRHVVQKPSVAPSSRSVVRHPRTNGEMARAARVRARQQRRNAKPRLGLAAR
ncbi:UNVERIFIED_ORG: hypothetical protein ABIC54_004169 [Burkholderia sp. 1263]